MTHRSAAREIAQVLAQRIKPSRPISSPRYMPEGDRSGSEHAATLSDELFRRSGIAWSGCLTDADVTAASVELGAALDWDEQHTADERRRFQSEWNELFSPPHLRAARSAIGLTDRSQRVWTKRQPKRGDNDSWNKSHTA
jgi:hypothetical protein